jgi:hypothetical protein
LVHAAERHQARIRLAQSGQQLEHTSPAEGVRSRGDQVAAGRHAQNQILKEYFAIYIEPHAIHGEGRTCGQIQFFTAIRFHREVHKVTHLVDRSEQVIERFQVLAQLHECPDDRRHDEFSRDDCPR